MTRQIGLLDAQVVFPEGRLQKDDVLRVVPLSPSEQKHHWPNGFPYLPAFASEAEVLATLERQVGATLTKCSAPGSRILLVAFYDQIGLENPEPEIVDTLIRAFPGYRIQGAFAETKCYGVISCLELMQDMIERDAFDYGLVVSVSAKALTVRHAASARDTIYCDGALTLLVGRGARNRFTAFAEHFDSTFLEMYHAAHQPEERLYLQNLFGQKEVSNLERVILECVRAADASLDRIDYVGIPFVSPDMRAEMLTRNGLMDKWLKPRADPMGIIGGIGCFYEFSETFNREDLAEKTFVLSSIGFGFGWNAMTIAFD